MFHILIITEANWLNTHTGNRSIVGSTLLACLYCFSHQAFCILGRATMLVKQCKANPSLFDYISLDNKGGFRKLYHASANKCIISVCIGDDTCHIRLKRKGIAIYFYFRPKRKCLTLYLTSSKRIQLCVNKVFLI